MNRHHPYAGSYDSPTTRRGGPPGPFGPDRSHRFSDRGGPPRGRGFGRGRGGGASSYGSYDTNFGAYDQGPPQGDMGGYNNYDAGPTQDSFYQNGNGNFNATVPGQYGASPDSPSRFSQGYGTFEGALENHVEVRQHEIQRASLEASQELGATVEISFMNLEISVWVML